MFESTPHTSKPAETIPPQFSEGELHQEEIAIVAGEVADLVRDLTRYTSKTWDAALGDLREEVADIFLLREVESDERSAILARARALWEQDRAMLH